MNVSRDIPYYIHVYNIPYFLEFFLRVLLISECANMWVQFEGRNNTRSGAINIATLPCSYVHCTSGRFSPRWFLVCDTVSGTFRRVKGYQCEHAWRMGKRKRRDVRCFDKLIQNYWYHEQCVAITHIQMILTLYWGICRFKVHSIAVCIHTRNILPCYECCMVPIHKK